LGRGLVSPPDEPQVELDPAADPQDARWFTERPLREVGDLLSGQPFALRAAAVTINDRAVALIGHGSAGKSLVAAALARRGYPVLADHRLPVDVREGVMALPTTNQLDLWPAGADLVGLAPDDGVVVRPALRKRAHAFPLAEAGPLALIVILTRQPDADAFRIDPVLGGDALGRLHHSTVGAPLLEPLGIQAPHFRWMVAVTQSATVLRLTSDRNGRDVGAVADAVENAAR
jgi:hypothetical protein